MSAMSTLGACLGRSVWYEDGQDVHTLYPMLNLLLIGPSGTGKSTSLGMGFKLVESLPKPERPQTIRGAATPEKLHDDLRTNPHAILFCSELANFFSKQKYMEGMIPYVTELLDYGQEMERRTKSQSLITVDKPSVTVMGGSTVEWLQGALPDTAAAGGFLARFLIVQEDYKSRNEPLPGRSLGKAQRAALDSRRLDAFAEFRRILNTHRGRIDFRDYGASDVYGMWYTAHTPANGHLAPFAARAGEMVLRMSVLLALSCGRATILAEDVRAATSLYSYFETKLQSVVVPFTPQGKLIARVLEAVGPTGSTDIQIRRAMRNFCASQETDRIVAGLLLSNDLRRNPKGSLVRTTS